MHVQKKYFNEIVPAHNHQLSFNPWFWTKEPIRPGRKRIVKIKYDAGSPGVFHKTIKVFYNRTGSPAQLEIRWEVQSPVGEGEDK